MKDKDTLYARWLSNEITEEELQFLTENGAIDDLQQIKNLTDSWKLSPYDKTEGLKKLKEKQAPKQAPKQTTQRRSYMKWGLGVVASLILLAILYYYNNPKEEVIIAKNGSIENIKLVDGSIIIANAGSTVKYNKDNWSSNRSIDLKGEAFFEVEKGSPFVVNTINGSVAVLGTQFNVRAWGSNLYVECYEGSVRVKAGKRQTILTRNTSVNVINGEMNSNALITNTAPLWSSGTSRFYEEPVNEVIAEIGRQYDVGITMPAMKQEFSGIFTHDDINAALRSVCIPLGIKYILSDDKKEVFIE